MPGTVLGTGDRVVNMSLYPHGAYNLLNGDDRLTRSQKTDKHKTKSDAPYVWKSQNNVSVFEVGGKLNALERMVTEGLTRSHLMSEFWKEISWVKFWEVFQTQGSKVGKIMVCPKEMIRDRVER